MAEEDILVINVPEETNREKLVTEVANKARETALEKLGKAATLDDYLRWHTAWNVFFNPRNIDWIWDYGGTTAEDLLKEQENEGFTKMYATNASAINAMKPSLDALEPKEGTVRVALKRIRDETGRYDYRVLAAFPEKTVSDAVIWRNEERTGEDIVFLEPSNACVNHACDDLFKKHRGKAFYMPYKTYKEALFNLQNDQSGANEYLLEKTELGNITQDAENYILVALLGGYSNEPFRVRISDFWNRSP